MELTGLAMNHRYRTKLPPIAKTRRAASATAFRIGFRQKLRPQVALVESLSANGGQGRRGAAGCPNLPPRVNLDSSYGDQFVSGILLVPSRGWSGAARNYFKRAAVFSECRLRTGSSNTAGVYRFFGRHQ